MEETNTPKNNNTPKRYLQTFIIATSIFLTLWGTSCNNYLERYGTKDNKENSNADITRKDNYITSEDDLERIISWNEYIKE